MTCRRYDVACRAIRGARKRQEDAATVWPGPSTYEAAAGRPEPPADVVLGVLADGMGGHAGGEIASRLVCEGIVQSFIDSDPATLAVERLETALEMANMLVANTVKEHRALDGMGATAVAILAMPEGLHWISVGDSPLYLVRQREVALLNEDHSLAPALDQLVEAGKLTEEQARNDPRRHMLRSAVTGDMLELIDTSRRPLELADGDIIVLASDGIHTIDTEEIARIATGYASDGADAIAEALLRAVETVRDPMQDNTTLIVLRPLFDAD